MDVAIAEGSGVLLGDGGGVDVGTGVAVMSLNRKASPTMFRTGVSSPLASISNG